jgi:hypothetical protein
MDAPLLATECVTADARAGTAVALATLALAVLKLAWVRRALPGLLSARAALVLAAQSAFVLAVPVAAVHLAGARLLTSRTLWLLWWATLALPAAQRLLRAETRRQSEGEWGPGASAWTWAPAALVVMHLWAVGYIHAIPFQPAFLSPVLLGVAVTADRERRALKAAPPALAIVLSLGQGGPLGFTVLGQAFVSPLRVALVAAVAAWGYLAWRDRERWLAVLAGSLAAGGLLGSLPSGAWRAIVRILLLVEAHRPRGAFGWGVVAVVAAFVLLAAGARRSLAVTPRPRRGGGLLADESAEGR